VAVKGQAIFKTIISRKKRWEHDVHICERYRFHLASHMTLGRDLDA
jgi:hypothetical protein